jgi:hypothetical protein
MTTTHAPAKMLMGLEATGSLPTYLVLR